MARPTQPLVLTELERAKLEQIARRSRSARRAAFRAKIVLGCASGLANTEVAKQLRTSGQTVGLWRKRFVEQRLEGLRDEPRPGRHRQIEDERIEEVVTKTLESIPRSATHWSTRQMAQNVGLSHTTIGRIWRAFGLQPHRSERYAGTTPPRVLRMAQRPTRAAPADSLPAR